jgi:catechol 2,3-dioxygenase-like lactoylglutathione lyase family enzyme
MPTQSNIQFGRFAPTIAVTDMGRSLQFYTEALGMKKTFENGSPVGFVILQMDAAEIHLTLSKNHAASDRNVAHLLVSDAKALYDQLEAKGARIIKGLRDADYKMRGFVFADPDGNRIDVGQEL